MIFQMADVLVAIKATLLPMEHVKYLSKILIAKNMIQIATVPNAQQDFLSVKAHADL